MEILKFKTDIESKENQTTLTSLLENASCIAHWNTQPDNHILTVSGEELDPEQVKKLVEKAGFKVELIQAFGVSGKGL